jgi:SAM-dependent methyltransferase
MAPGPYDRLYACRDLLWPAEPGRMVRRAHAISVPGRALDAGCGDGKNAAFLIERDWSVDAFDVSSLATDACRRRLGVVSKSPRLRLWQADCRSAVLVPADYDMVISYGLYHCLNDVDLHSTHYRLARSLKPGGLFVCATLNDNLPLPRDHGTDSLTLRAEHHLRGLFTGWDEIQFEIGTIEEDHLPLVARHHHSLTWAIYRRPV